MTNIKGFQIKNYILELIRKASYEISMNLPAGERPSTEDIITFIKNLPDEYLEILFIQK